MQIFSRKLKLNMWHHDRLKESFEKALIYTEG